MTQTATDCGFHYKPVAKTSRAPDEVDCGFAPPKAPAMEAVTEAAPEPPPEAPADKPKRK